MQGIVGAKAYCHRKEGPRAGTSPDRVLVQVGVGRGALVTAVGQLVWRCPRALQIHQLWCRPCCQSCIHTYRLCFIRLHWCSDDEQNRFTVDKQHPFYTRKCNWSLNKAVQQSMKPNSKASGVGKDAGTLAC